MTSAASRVYWDACAWIAFIQKEMPSEDSSFQEPRFTMCKRVLERAVRGEIEIATSAYTLAEVCKRPLDPSSPGRNLPVFFDQQYVLLVTVDKQIGLKAQSLQVAGVSGLKPQDATHIASALVWNIPIFHTFDQRLLALNGSLTLDNGDKLTIMRPSEDEPAGLFDALE